MDVAFVIDGSSQSRPQFNAMKNLMKSFVSNLDIGKGKNHIGIVKYGGSAEIALPFDSLNNFQAIDRHIDGIQPRGGSARLDQAVAKTKDLFTIERGHRPGVSKVAVFMVNSRYGGRDTDLRQAVQKLRRDGVRVYVVASNRPEQQRLQTLAPVEDITRITGFSGIGNIVMQLVKYIRDQDKGNFLSTFSPPPKLTPSRSAKPI